MIHKYKAKEINIVLDVNSGGVHVVDDITYDLLDYVEPPFSMECPEKALQALQYRKGWKKSDHMHFISVRGLSRLCCLPA